MSTQILEMNVFSNSTYGLGGDPLWKKMHRTFFLRTFFSRTASEYFAIILRCSN